MVLRLFIFSLISLSFTAHAGLSHLFGLPIWTLSCESVLLPISKLHQPHTQPLTSLREVISYAEQITMRRLDPSVVPLEAVDAEIINEKNAPNIINRWRAIEKDLTQLQDGRFAVGYEIRGEQNIREAVQAVQAEYSRLTPHLNKTLREQLPLMRPTNAFRFAMRGAALIVAGAAFMDPGVGNILLATALVSSQVIGTILSLADSVDTGFGSFLLQINKHLHDPNFNSALVYGHHFKTSPVYAKELVRNLSEPESQMDPTIQRRAAVSKARSVTDFLSDMLQGPTLDKNNLPIADALDTARDPSLEVQEGAVRKHNLDQIFYRDPNTKELVWLVFYRTYKGQPPRPKKPREKKDTQSEENWLPGLLPQPVPIPIPVSDR